MLSGTWSPATLKHYNAGVSKLLIFAAEYGVPRSQLLPIDPEVLLGVKAWHLFHGFNYPHNTTPRVEGILKAAKKLEIHYCRSNRILGNGETRRVGEGIKLRGPSTS